MGVIPFSAREIDNLLGQHRVIAVSGRNSVPSFGNFTACFVSCGVKRTRMSATSKLAEHSAADTKFVFHYKVGHVVWKPGVVTRGWLHPRRHNTCAFNGYSVAALSCSCECDSHSRPSFSVSDSIQPLIHYWTMQDQYIMVRSVGLVSDPQPFCESERAAEPVDSFTHIG